MISRALSPTRVSKTVILNGPDGNPQAGLKHKIEQFLAQFPVTARPQLIARLIQHVHVVDQQVNYHSNLDANNEQLSVAGQVEFDKFVDKTTEEFRLIIRHTGFLGKRGYNKDLTTRALALLEYLETLKQEATVQTNRLDNQLTSPRVNDGDKQTIITFMNSVLPEYMYNQIPGIVDSMTPEQIEHIATVARNCNFFNEHTCNSALSNYLKDNLTLVTKQRFPEQSIPPLMRFFIRSLQFGMGTIETNRATLQNFIDEYNKANHATTTINKNFWLLNRRRTTLECLKAHPERIDNLGNLKFKLRLTYSIIHAISSNDAKLMNALGQKLGNNQQSNLEEKNDDDQQPYNNAFINAVVDLLSQKNQEVLNALNKNNELKRTVVSNWLSRINHNSPPDPNLVALIIDQLRQENEGILITLLKCSNTQLKVNVVEGLLQGQIPNTIKDNAELQLFIIGILSDEAKEKELNRRMDVWKNGKENKDNLMNPDCQARQNTYELSARKLVTPTYKKFQTALFHQLLSGSNDELRIAIIEKVTDQALELTNPSLDQSTQEQQNHLTNLLQCITKLLTQTDIDSLESKLDDDNESKSYENYPPHHRINSKLIDFLNSLNPGLLLTPHKEEIVKWMRSLGAPFIYIMPQKIVQNLGTNLVQFLVDPDIDQQIKQHIRDIIDINAQKKGNFWKNSTLDNDITLVIKRLLETENDLLAVLRLLETHAAQLTGHFQPVKMLQGLHLSIISVDDIVKCVLKNIDQSYSDTTKCQIKSELENGNLNNTLTSIITVYSAGHTYFYTNTTTQFIGFIFDWACTTEWINGSMPDELLAQLITKNDKIFPVVFHTSGETFDGYMVLLLNHILAGMTNISSDNQTDGTIQAKFEDEVIKILHCMDNTSEGKIAITVTKALTKLEMKISDNLLKKLLMINVAIINYLSNETLSRLPSYIYTTEDEDYVTKYMKVVEPHVFGNLLLSFLMPHLNGAGLWVVFYRIADYKRRNLVNHLLDNPDLVKAIVSTMTLQRFIDDVTSICGYFCADLLVHVNLNLLMEHIEEKDDEKIHHLIQGITNLEFLENFLFACSEKFGEKKYTAILNHTWKELIIGHASLLHLADLISRMGGFDKNALAKLFTYQVEKLIKNTNQAGFKLYLEVLSNNQNNTQNFLEEKFTFVLGKIIELNKFDLIRNMDPKLLMVYSPQIVIHFSRITTENNKKLENADNKKSNELEKAYNEKSNELEKAYNENKFIAPSLVYTEGSLAVVTAEGEIILFDECYTPVLAGETLNLNAAMTGEQRQQAITKRKEVENKLLSSSPTLVLKTNDNEYKDYEEHKGEDDKLTYKPISHNDTRIPEILRKEIRKCVIPIDRHIKNMFDKFDELVPRAHRLSPEQMPIIQECLSVRPSDIRNMTIEERWELFCGPNGQTKLYAYFNAIINISHDDLFQILCQAFNVELNNKEVVHKLLLALAILFLRLSSKINLGVDGNINEVGNGINQSAIGPRLFGGHLLKIFAQRKYPTGPVPPKLQRDIDDVNINQCSHTIATSLSHMFKANAFQFTDTSTFKLNIDCD